jgi:hypothetical protein
MFLLSPFFYSSSLNNDSKITLESVRFINILCLMGHSEGYLVKALCYKPKDREFESLMRSPDFSIDLILPSARWP